MYYLQVENGVFCIELFIHVLLIHHHRVRRGFPVPLFVEYAQGKLVVYEQCLSARMCLYYSYDDTPVHL